MRALATGGVGESAVRRRREHAHVRVRCSGAQARSRLKRCRSTAHPRASEPQLPQLVVLVRPSPSPRSAVTDSQQLYRTHAPRFSPPRTRLVALARPFASWSSPHPRRRPPATARPPQCTTAYPPSTYCSTAHPAAHLTHAASLPLAPPLPHLIVLLATLVLVTRSTGSHQALRLLLRSRQTAPDRSTGPNRP